MDDALGFNGSKKIKELLFTQEKELVNKSKYIFCTAEYLKEKIIQRYSIKDQSKIIISNNAINLPEYPINVENCIKEKKKICLTYIGTISSWFDFDLIKKLDDKKYVVKLYGPVDVKAKVQKNNIYYYGSIQHEKIFQIMQEADILIMPFKVNELIRSVNPVKLYEYIYSNKPVISVKYTETEKFNDFVYLYESGNVEDFTMNIEIIRQNSFSSKNTRNKIDDFLINNTWNARIKQILNTIS